MFTNTFNPPDRIATPGVCQQLLQLEDYYLQKQLCFGFLTLRGQLSQICDVYMHLVKLIIAFRGPFMETYIIRYVLHDFRNSLVPFSHV